MIIRRPKRLSHTPLYLLLIGLSPLSSANDLTPVALDPLQALERSAPAPISTGEITGPFGLYLLGNPAGQVPAEVSLWRFDGTELQRIPLPDTPLSDPSADTGLTDKTRKGVLLLDAYYLEGNNNDLYIRHNLRFTNPASSSYRWWWSDGFSARALSPHPVMTTPLQRVGDSTYGVSDATLWRVIGREDQVESVATLPAGEFFFALDQQGAGLILWTLGGTPQSPRITQWDLQNSELTPLASLPVGAGTSEPLWAGDRWYLDTADGELWQVLDGVASQVMGINGAEALTVIGDSLYLSAIAPAAGREPHRVSGTDAVLLADLLPGPNGSFPERFLPCGEGVCFTALGSDQQRLWYGQHSAGVDPLPLQGEALSLAAQVYNDALYLVAAAADGVPTLYQSRDGATVTEIAPACGIDEFIYPQWAFDASLYIRATGCPETELYRQDDPATPLVNLSVNTTVLGTLSPGFVVSGNGGRFALLGESQYPADAPPLADPVLSLRNLNTGEILGENDNWRDHPRVAELLAEVRRPGSETDAALVLDLPPGNYVAELRDRQGRRGQGLLSIQQLDGMRELINISANTQVRDEGVVPGFVVQGEGGRFAIIGEAQYQSGAALPNPRIVVRDLVTGMVLDQNDNWQDHPSADELVQAVRAPGGQRDAALVLDLPLGAYVVELRDTENRSGQALLSIQQVLRDD